MFHLFEVHALGPVLVFWAARKGGIATFIRPGLGKRRTSGILICGLSSGAAHLGSSAYSRSTQYGGESSGIGIVCRSARCRAFDQGYAVAGLGS